MMVFLTEETHKSFQRLFDRRVYLTTDTFCRAFVSYLKRIGEDFDSAKNGISDYSTQNGARFSAFFYEKACQWGRRGARAICRVAVAASPAPVRFQRFDHASIRTLGGGAVVPRCMGKSVVGLQPLRRLQGARTRNAVTGTGSMLLESDGCHGNDLGGRQWRKSS